MLLCPWILGCAGHLLCWLWAFQWVVLMHLCLESKVTLMSPKAIMLEHKDRGWGAGMCVSFVVLGAS